MSIRLKVILPYLLLTVIVSVIGVYVVTRLVSNTIQERLTNQLLEAGRVVSDGFVRQESSHVDAARILSYTTGLAEALAGEERETALDLVRPAAAGLGLDNVILVSAQGSELVHLVADKNGVLQKANKDTQAEDSFIVAQMLKNKNPEEPPRRALGVNLVNGETYYYTSLPVVSNDKFAGVVVVGTSIHKILPYLKSTSLADVVIYSNDGQAIGSTLEAGDQTIMDLLSITEEEYQQSIHSDKIVQGRNIEVHERPYSLARGPLQVGSDRIGVFAVALPLDYVVKSAMDSRTTYMILFTAVFFVVVVIGFLVSRRIIVPLYSLVRTSQAIAGGDLDKRTGIKANDEIGTLANTFDEMTARLQERTAELEFKNQILRNLEKTKTNFIQISAHELRTPLTLIMGYAQMLEQDTKDNPELQALSQGLLDGSERMTDIVDSMLDVSRIDSNALFLRKTGLRIDLLIKKVKKNFEKALEERNLHMTVEGMDDLPLIPADPDLLQKVFHHLIMNAIKFTPDGGSIKVSGKYLNGSEPPQVEIAVCDTGIGIDPSLHHLIFEKFNQTGDVLLHSSGKTKFKGGGPGLGLAIARGIVQAHGGKIWVESPGYNEIVNPGSTFFVSLPVGKQLESES
jgi:signal transduction histidine kinase